MPLVATTKVTNSNKPDKQTKNPWPVALRILTRRDYSESELRKRLKIREGAERLADQSHKDSKAEIAGNIHQSGEQDHPGVDSMESDAIDDTIQRCLELGYLDDLRFAENRATSLMRQGRAVGRRVLLDLQQRGISEDIAQQALDKALETCSEDQLLNELLTRKFPDFNYNSAPAKERRRVVHFLQRRGFPISRIMEQLTRKGTDTSNEDRQ